MKSFFFFGIWVLILELLLIFSVHHTSSCSNIGKRTVMLLLSKGTTIKCDIFSSQHANLLYFYLFIFLFHITDDCYKCKLAGLFWFPEFILASLPMDHCLALFGRSWYWWYTNHVSFQNIILLAFWQWKLKSLSVWVVTLYDLILTVYCCLNWIYYSWKNGSSTSSDKMFKHIMC